MSTSGPESENPQNHVCSLPPSRVYETLGERLKGTSVYFVGMMGCGKSATSEIFAKKLGYRKLDTDEIAEFMCEMPISDFFAAGNEKIFRDLEYQVLMELAQYTRVVVSTGGGIVERNTNWGVMRHGLVVFLDMQPNDIYRRLCNDSGQIAKRPLLQGENPLQKLIDMHKLRIEKYALADIHVQITSDLSIEQVTDKVAAEILRFIENNPPLWKQRMKDREGWATASVANSRSTLSDVNIPEGVALPKATNELSEGV